MTDEPHENDRHSKIGEEERDFFSKAVAVRYTNGKIPAAKGEPSQRERNNRCIGSTGSLS